MFVIIPILNAGNDNEVYNLYLANEKKCEKYSKIIELFVIFHTSTFVIAFIHAIINIVMSNYDTLSWNLSLVANISFDKTHVLGWFITWAFQFLLSLAYSLPMTSVTSYFGSYIVTMCDHFNLIINGMKIDVERNKLEKNLQKLRMIRRKLTRQLCHAIEFHTKIVEYVKSTFC